MMSLKIRHQGCRFSSMSMPNKTPPKGPMSSPFTTPNGPNAPNGPNMPKRQGHGGKIFGMILLMAVGSASYMAYTKYGMKEDNKEIYEQKIEVEKGYVQPLYNKEENIPKTKKDIIKEENGENEENEENEKEDEVLKKKEEHEKEVSKNEKKKELKETTVTQSGTTDKEHKLAQSNSQEKKTKAQNNPIEEIEEVAEEKHEETDPEKKKIFQELEKMSPEELRNRIAELTTELKILAKEEALNLLQSMRSMDNESNKINAQTLRDQAALYDELLNRKLYLQKEKLTEEHKASVMTLTREYKKKMKDILAAEEEKKKEEIEHEVDAVEKKLSISFNEKLNEKALEYEELVEEERQKHREAIEKMNLELDAMRQVLEVTSANEAYSWQVHRLSAAILTLSNELDTSHNFINELRILKEAKKGDYLVESVYDSFPSSFVSGESPVVSLTELRTRYKLVEKYGRRRALIGDGKSFASQVLGTVTSYLLLSPTAPVEGDDTEAILSRASYHVEHSNLIGAISELSRLPPSAAEVAQDWIKDAKERVQVEQGMRILGAHAALLASSCS